jgi:hypothetical protein
MSFSVLDLKKQWEDQVVGKSIRHYHLVSRRHKKSLYRLLTVYLSPRTGIWEEMAPNNPQGGI